MLQANVKGQRGVSSLCVCVRVSKCRSCVSIDPRRVESGAGAVAGRHAPRRSSVGVLSQEASKSRR